MKRSIFPVLLLGLFAARLALAQPLGTAFTYQGELRTSGVLSSGPHDLRCRLYDAALGGSQVGATLCVNNLTVVEGRFTAELDFGPVFSGQQRYLEIDVRADAGLDCSNSAGFVVLGPRQALTATPNAAFSLNAASAATAANSTQLNGQPASFYQDASNLIAGTMPDARLASTVARTNTAQTFTGALTFSAAPAFSGAGAPFSVASTTLVPNLNADLLDGLNSTAFLQAIPNPLALSGSSASSHIIYGENAAGDGNSSGVYGRSTATSGLTYGVRGRSDSSGGAGVYGYASSATGDAIGVWGSTSSPDGDAVYGYASSLTGVTNGVWGRVASTSGRAVFGRADATSGTTYGGRFENASTGGVGAFGLATAATGTTNGLVGQSDSTSGHGVLGSATAASGLTYGGHFSSQSSTGIGAFGHAAASTGGAYGLFGQSDSTSGRGVYGVAINSSGTTFGVYGRSDSTSGTAVFGQATASTGITSGLYGRSDATSGRGVFAWAAATTGSTVGVLAWNESTSGVAVRGQAFADTGDTFGVLGECQSTAGHGVHGLATATTGSTFGGYFESNSTGGYGVYGRNGASTGTIYGVRGYASTAASGYAVYAAGDMGASGLKPFRIDHPQDPENKYLLHYAAESPEVINFYSGKVTLDGGGEAVVELPAYFASINKDPRYTLTAIGSPMPMLHVAAEISEESLAAGEQAQPGVAPPMCSFRIAGGVPGAKVSWEVKAVRNDLRMRLHGAPVEREKIDPERGKYQHPEYYGLPAARGMDDHVDARRGRQQEEKP